jgi:hypothetical protein
MNAHEAREKAKAFNTDKTNGQYARAMKAIETSASQGKYETHIDITLNEDATAALQAEGFNVKTVDDQRDGSFTIIKWK